MNGLMPMGRRSKSLMLFTALAAFWVESGAAQIAPKPAAAKPPAVKTAKPEPVAAPAALAGKPEQPAAAQVAPAPPPLPPAVWDPVSAQDLVYYIQQVGADGLNPADYDAAALTAAIQSRDPVAMSVVATERFNQLSSDLALGHVKRSARIAWYMVDNDLDAAKQDALLR